MNVHLLAAMLCLIAVQAPGQVPKAFPPAVPIVLGQSVYPLNGPYKFSIGDSPLDPATHQPLWAQPNFEDSSWENTELTPEEGGYDPILGLSGFVPGWTAKGHPGYSGYAWYRIRVTVDAQSAGTLALAGPSDVDDGYEVFDNGILVGSFGNFSSNPPTVYDSQPMLFRLPAALRGDARSNTHVLAFRVWMNRSSLIASTAAGGLHNAPLLGEASAISASYQMRWLGLVRSYATAPLLACLFLLLAALAFSLGRFDRSDKVYSWIVAVFLLLAGNTSITSFAVWSQTVSMPLEVLLLGDFSVPLIMATWVMVWWVWFRLQRPAWVPKAIAALTLLYIVANLFGQETLFSFVPQQVSAGFHLLSTLVRLAFLALLVAIVMLGVRGRGREGWIALPAVVLLAVSRFQSELEFLHLRLHWYPFGIGVSLAVMSQVLLVLALFVFLFRRLFLSLRAQREQALDIKQAAEVQQVILPESRLTFPHLFIETEYRPARQVGGDFFQIIPHATDGSVLVVAGDVTGKGLQAGMTVALLIGAIRSTAELLPAPLVLLEALNRRLLGRRSAQATCLALSITADGQVTLANAGHLPPYLNGNPIDMEGALPLGMMDGAEFSVMRFQMEPGDRLVLISDGILEATNQKGQLFGFDRVQKLLQAQTPIAALADQAQQFGQDDDISLVALRRTA